MGHEKFLVSFNKVREHITNTKLSRKRKMAVEKVVNPEAAAVRKRKKTEMKVASRKRKVEEHKMTEGRSGGAKKRRA